MSSEFQSAVELVVFSPCSYFQFVTLLEHRHSKRNIDLSSHSRGRASLLEEFRLVITPYKNGLHPWNYFDLSPHPMGNDQSRKNFDLSPYPMGIVPLQDE